MDWVFSVTMTNDYTNYQHQSGSLSTTNIAARSMFVTELKDPTTMYADDLEDLEELDEHMEAYIK